MKMILPVIFDIKPTG